MAISTFLDSFNVGTGSVGTTIARSGYGFQPKCFIIWTTGRTQSTDSVGGGNVKRSIGFGVSATDRRCVGAYSGDAQIVAITGGHRRTDSVLVEATGSTSASGLLDISSIDTDGITFIIDAVFATDLRVHVLAFGGSDITNAITSSFDSGVSATNLSVTGVGFQPTILFFGLRGIGTGENSGVIDDTMGLGYAISSTKQGVCVSGSNSSSSTMQTIRYGTSAECYAAFDSGVTSTTVRGALLTMDTDGFTIDRNEAASSTRIYYMAIKGGNWDGGVITTREDANDIAVAGLSFQPNGLLFCSHCTAESTLDTAQVHSMLSLGGGTSATSRGAHGCSDEDNLSDSETATAIEFDEVYAKLNLADGIDALMDLKSIESTGFTCVMDDVEPTGGASFVWWAACGNVAAAGQPARRRLGGAKYCRNYGVDEVGVY